MVHVLTLNCGSVKEVKVINPSLLIIQEKKMYLLIMMCKKFIPNR